MMKKTVLFLLLCMAAAPGLSQTLTLDECRAAAEEHNRTLKTSRLDLDAALQARREAFTNYFPQISASGGVFQAQHGLVQADFAIPQMESLPLSLVKRGILGSVTAVQPLFAGLKIVSGNKLARLGEEVAQLQLQKTAAEVRERTDTYFWQVVSLRDNLSTIEAVERQLAEIHRQVALSVKAGLVTTNDLLRVCILTHFAYFTHCFRDHLSGNTVDRCRSDRLLKPRLCDPSDTFSAVNKNLLFLCFSAF